MKVTITLECNFGSLSMMRTCRLFSLHQGKTYVLKTSGIVHRVDFERFLNFALKIKNRRNLWFFSVKQNLWFGSQKQCVLQMRIQVRGIEQLDDLTSLNKKIMFVSSILSLIFEIKSRGFILRQHGSIVEAIMLRIVKIWRTISRMWRSPLIAFEVY